MEMPTAPKNPDFPTPLAGMTTFAPLFLSKTVCIQRVAGNQAAKMTTFRRLSDDPRTTPGRPQDDLRTTHGRPTDDLRTTLGRPSDGPLTPLTFRPLRGL